MNIEKAIEILKQYSKPPLPSASANFCDAVKLGEEALKHCQRLRRDFLFYGGILLPGETKD